MHEPLVRDVIGEAISKSIQNLIRCLVTTVPSKGKKLQPFLYCLPKFEVLEEKCAMREKLNKKF